MGIYNIPDISSDAAKFLGRSEQVKAFSRRNLTPSVNRYQPLRVEWAHAFFPGQDHRLGKLTPLQAQLADAIARHIDPAHQLEAAARLGLPPAPTGATSGGLRLGRPHHAPPRPPQQPTREAPPPEYTILETGGVLSLNAFRQNATAPAISPQAIRTINLRGPKYLLSIAFERVPDGNNNVQINVECPQVGFAYSGIMTASFGVGVANTIPMGFIAPNDVTLRIEILPDFSGAGTAKHSVNAWIAYRDVTARTRRNPVTLENQPAPDEEITGTLYADFTAAAVDALLDAGIPADWWTRYNQTTAEALA